MNSIMEILVHCFIWRASLRLFKLLFKVIVNPTNSTRNTLPATDMSVECGAAYISPQTLFVNVGRELAETAGYVPRN